MARLSEASSQPFQEVEADVGGPAVSSTDSKSRSANINSDPKMRELTHYMRSHQHESRLRESAELEKRVPSAVGGRRTLRAEGCEVIDSKMKQLSKSEASIPYIMKSSELPEAFREKQQRRDEMRDSMEQRMAMLRRMDRFQTRIGWRDSMDHSLKRLLIDINLSNNERYKEFESKPAKMSDSLAPPKPVGEEEKEPTEEELKEKAKLEERKMRFARARCEHLDKVFDWYEVHGMKEARKERKAPPYLRYDPQHPVMPGSMRVAPLMLSKPSQPGPGMGHSSSSPALVAAGAAATAGPPSSSGGDPAAAAPLDAPPAAPAGP
jgi:hypothetical protein